MTGHGGDQAIVPRMPSHPRPAVPPRRGVTLVELLVALVLVTIGVLALAGTTAAATRAAARGARMADAATAARSRMERLAARRCAAIAPGESVTRGRTERWTIVASPPGARRLRVETLVDAPGGARRATLEGTIPCAE